MKRNIGIKALAALAAIAVLAVPAFGQQPLSIPPASQVRGVLGPANGGTGVANNSAATLTRSGNHAVTLTTTGTTNVTLPTTGTLATQTYVDDFRQALGFKPAARIITTTNITLSGAQTYDGVALVAGDRVVVNGQTDQTQNGIYAVASGAWTRPTDADTWAELVGALIVVGEGTANHDTVWLCNVDPGGTVGSTAITFSQSGSSGVGSAFLPLAGGTLTGPITFFSNTVADTPILLSWTPASSAMGKFYFNFGEPPFGPSNVRDPAMSWGYNCKLAGVPLQAGEPCLIYNIESRYDDNSGHLKMETYFHYVSADGSVNTRPLFFQMDRVTNKVANAQIKADTFKLLYEDGSANEAGGNMVTFSKNTATFFAPNTATNSLSLQAASGQTSQLQLGFSATPAYMTVFPTAANAAKITLNTRDVMYFWSNALSASIPAVSIGVQDANAAFTAKAGNSAHKGIVGRGLSTAQTAAILEAQDSASNPLFSVSPKGHLVVGNWSSAGTSTISIPAVSACGTSPAISATSADSSWRVTVGTGGSATSCTITFASTFGNTPNCVVTGSADGDLITPSESTTAVTVSRAAGGALTAGSIIKGFCPRN
jgi:hypothetical protein